MAVKRKVPPESRGFLFDTTAQVQAPDLVDVGISTAYQGFILKNDPKAADLIAHARGLCALGYNVNTNWNPLVLQLANAMEQLLIKRST